VPWGRSHDRPPYGHGKAVAPCKVYSGDAIGRLRGSARHGLCALGAWREGKGSGRRCSNEWGLLVVWNAAPGSPRGSPASASKPSGTVVRAAHGVGVAGAFRSAQCLRKFSSSPV
jgi:hypothetical protein